MRKRRSVDKSPHVGRDYLRSNEANAVIEAAGRVGRQRLRDQVLLRLMYRLSKGTELSLKVGAEYSLVWRMV
jgi:hypothetical protein